MVSFAAENTTIVRDSSGDEKVVHRHLLIVSKKPFSSQSLSTSFDLTVHALPGYNLPARSLPSWSV